MQAARHVANWSLPEMGVAALSLAGGVGTAFWCGWLGWSYARELHPWCGTGADRVHQTLTMDVPLAFAVPAVGWLRTRKAPRASRIARCATLLAVLAWATVMACIHLSR